LWRAVGVYAFAIGYTAGAFAQLAIVWFAARRELSAGDAEPCAVSWREIAAKPAFFVVYAAALSLKSSSPALMPPTWGLGWPPL